MELLDELAHAALDRDNLRLRSLVQDLLHSQTPLSKLPRPKSHDPRLLSIAAAIVELLAERQGQRPPAWTKEIGALDEPFFMIKSASRMKHLRDLCEKESPEPMRKRHLYAPPNFLQFA